MEYCGLVEGFYWKAEHSVEGRYREFAEEKRKRLLEFMATKGLNLYVYDPKMLRGKEYERAYSFSPDKDGTDWPETFRVAAENGVHFVWGVAPGRYEHWEHREKELFATVSSVLDVGAAGFSMLFDDVAGAESEFEMRRQAELTNALNTEYPGKMHGMCAASYCGTREELEVRLACLDENLETSIDLVVTGSEVWPASIRFGDLPLYKSGRKWIVWDNWVACDTNDPERLELRPPRQRGHDLFSEIREYWLNLCFPVERIIPMVSAVGEMHRFGGSFPDEKEAELIGVMARDWAGFLDVDEEIILKFMMSRTGHDTGRLREASVQSIVERWRALGPILELVGSE